MERAHHRRRTRELPDAVDEARPRATRSRRRASRRSRSRGPRRDRGPGCRSARAGRRSGSGGTRLLERPVRDEHHHAIPRARAVLRAHLVPVPQGHGVAVVTVGDHQGFGREPRRDLRVWLAHPERVLDAGLVGGGRPGPLAIASSRNARTVRSDPGTPRGCSTGSSGPRASTGGVLDRPGHRLLVRHDRAARVLELHGADHAPDRAAPAVQREPHLVRVERRALGRDERLARAMSRARTPPAYTCRPSRPQRRRPVRGRGGSRCMGSRPGSAAAHRRR